MMTVTMTTARRVFNVYLTEATQWQANIRAFVAAKTRNFTHTPRTVTYRKKGDFWEVRDFDQQTDDEALNARLTKAA